MNDHMEPETTDTVVLPQIATFLQATSHGFSDCGRARTSNEDHYLVAEHAQALRVYHSSLPQPKTQYSQERSYLFLVADGLGGHKAGELASALAVETVANFILQQMRHPGEERTSVPSLLTQAFQRADARIFDEIHNTPESQGMGTTLTLAYTLGNDLFVAHAGDSRCYLFRHGGLRQLTEDHTVVTEMVQQGLLRQQEACKHKYRHMLTNVLGGPDRGVRVEIKHEEMEPGDMLVLCSDGLTDMLDDRVILEILETAPSPEVACGLLIEAANQKGGDDNVTAIVARFDYADTHKSAEPL